MKSKILYLCVQHKENQNLYCFTNDSNFNRLYRINIFYFCCKSCLTFFLFSPVLNCRFFSQQSVVQAHFSFASDTNKKTKITESLKRFFPFEKLCVFDVCRFCVLWNERIHKKLTVCKVERTTDSEKVGTSMIAGKQEI